MKTYIDHNEMIEFESLWIPKVSANSHYRQFLEEQKNGEAELVPYVPPSPTWEQIRQQRDQLLRETDWVGLKDVTVLNEQAWLDYRQALRDIPENFTNTEDVIWPIKPE